MNMKKGLLVCAICLVAGVMLWGQRRRADAVSSEIAALKSQIEQVTEEMEQLRAILEKGTAEAAEREQQRTLLELAGAASPAPRPGPPTATNTLSIAISRPAEYYWSDASDTVWVPKECVPQLGVRMLSRDPNNEWRVTDHGAAALVLSDTERAALNEALTDAVQRYQELARARFSQVIWPTPEEEAKGLWRVKYQVSAFPEEAAALSKQFADSVSDLLKGEKARLFLDSMGRWADMPFSAFGQKEMTILFEWTRTADDQWALQITETGINNSRPVKCGRTTTRQLQQTNIPPCWRHLIRS